MKTKILVLFVLLTAVFSGYAQKKKTTTTKSPYMKEAPKQKTKTPLPSSPSKTTKPAPIQPKEAPKTQAELNQRRAEIKAKEILEKKDAKETKEKAMKEMSFAQELASSSIQTTTGFRVGANILALNLIEVSPIRLSESGTPVLDKGSVVRDVFSSKGQIGVGYNVAMFFRISKGSFYIQPELMFQTKGGNFNIKKADNTSQKIAVRYGSVEIPLMFGIRSRNLRFTMGPSFGYGFKMNNNLSNAIKQYTDTPPASLIRKFNVGFNAGIGYEKDKNIFDFRMLFGLKKPIDFMLGNASTPTAFGLNPRVFQFSYGRILDGR